jgi:hypothetical protein
VTELPRRTPGASLAAAQTAHPGPSFPVLLACGDTVTLPAPVCVQPDLLGFGEGLPAYCCPEHGYQTVSEPA